MNKIIPNRIYIFLFLSIQPVLFSQTFRTEAVKEIFAASLENNYKIASLNIIPGSELITFKNRILSTGEYKFDFVKGTFSLSEGIKYSPLDTLYLEYRRVILGLRKEYRRRTLSVQFDEKSMDTTLALQRISEPISSESIFGKDLHKSGAIVRGFSIGTNRDFTLNSGLRLQLSGRLSDDVEIIAALTDENTPIQPEGNTEKLDELDKVFIELKHQYATGTFGDYELNLRESEFSGMTRRLQGLKGEFSYGNSKSLLAIAGSRGKFNTNQFNGTDGNQGPYRITGINNERAIIVIAGSERVYIDGQEMKRGENNDYTIDYSNSEITFTPKRLITSASRISIDFEYSDQNFKRNFFGGDFSTKFFNDKLKIGIGYFREGDDEASPIEYSFSDDDLRILEKAGDERENASRTGVTVALPDSLGRSLGIYTKIDTLRNDTTFSYYKYLPGAGSSIYNVSFTYVGEGNGDYSKESLLNYRFVGEKKGSYLPGIYLPMPELKQLANISIIGEISEGIRFSADLAGSSWDRNKFSMINDDDNLGYARNLRLEMSQREIKIGGTSFGKAGLSFKERFVEGRFSALDRIDEIEFGRNYNLSAITKKDQSLREIILSYSPVQEISFNTKYGSLKQGNDFSSERLLSQLKIEKKDNYQFNVDLDYVKSENTRISTSWLRNDGRGFISLGSLKSGIEYNYENKEDLNSNAITLLPTSLRLLEIAPFAEYNITSSIDARVRYSNRSESFPLNGIMTVQSSSATGQFQLNYKGLREFSTSLNVSIRDKKYTQEFKKEGYADNETVLLLSQSRINFWNGFISGDLFYQASTEQTARIEKVFIKVQRGSGNYIYIGDLNNNGIAEENEFQPAAYDGDFLIVTAPTEKLFPVIALKTNFRFKVEFNKIISDNNLLGTLLKPVSTETSFRIEENSRSENTRELYLLHLSKFMNDSTTIRGMQLFQNDLNLFQNSNALSLRFRFTQRRSFNQYNAGDEKAYFRERSLRFRIKMIEEISNQTEFINQDDNLIAPQVTNRARTVTRNNISTDFSYRPERNIEVGFKLEAGESRDTYRFIPSTININSITLRINLSFENLGRLRVEAERAELTSSSNYNDLPFEMTRGNSIGKNYFWRVFFDYRISSFVQTSFSYDARLHGAGHVIQTMRGEARAYF